MATPTKKTSKKTTTKAGAKKQGASPRRAASRATPPANGPVTLALARAIVAARAPMRAPAPAGAAVESALTQKSPADVARERSQLRLAQRRERTQRTRDYKAVMQIMKQRGVQDLAPSAQLAPPTAASARSKGPRRAAGAKVPSDGAGTPLQVLAEGDSWFDYPVPFFGGGIVTRLERLLGVPILNMAKAGDEVRYMMGVSERKLIAQRLREGCPAGGKWDVLLFSGGGNDIVGDPMALWVRDYVAGQPPEQSIHRPRFDAAMAMVQAGCEDLIALRDAISPGTHLVFHTYDFAIPDGRGICKMGPWLKPTFELRGFPSLETRFEVVKLMLTGLRTMLEALQAVHTGVTVFNVQGTLDPLPSSWHNELHPARQGFDKFAALFATRLRILFPNRVL